MFFILTFITGLDSGLKFVFLVWVLDGIFDFGLLFILFTIKITVFLEFLSVCTFFFNFLNFFGLFFSVFSYGRLRRIRIGEHRLLVRVWLLMGGR